MALYPGAAGWFRKLFLRQKAVGQSAVGKAPRLTHRHLWHSLASCFTDGLFRGHVTWRSQNFLVRVMALSVSTSRASPKSVRCGSPFDLAECFRA